MREKETRVVCFAYFAPSFMKKIVRWRWSKKRNLYKECRNIPSVDSPSEKDSHRLKLLLLLRRFFKEDVFPEDTGDSFDPPAAVVLSFDDELSKVSILLEGDNFFLHESTEKAFLLWCCLDGEVDEEEGPPVTRLPQSTPIAVTVVEEEDCDDPSPTIVDEVEGEIEW